MKRRIVSIILALALILTVCGVGCIGVSAEDNVATITVGNKTYTAKVGDFIEYSISFRSTGDNITTAQVELPVDFSAFSGYSESEIDTHLARIAPTTAENSVVKRFDKSNTFGLTGYVLNFVNVNGYSFRTEKEIMKLIFCVEKAGSYNLTAKVRNVNDINENVVIDGNYTLQDPRFSYVENLTEAELETPQPKVATFSGGMRISWDPVPGARLYRVYVKSESAGWVRIKETNETSYIDTDVVSGKRYTYTVRCMSQDGSRFISDYDRDGESAIYYTAPILRLSSVEDGVKIDWDAVPQASSYRVYYRGTNGWTKLVDTKGTSVIDEDVVSGTRYTYTIRAMDQNGNHLSWFYQDGFSITYLSAPDFSLSNVANGVQIKWDPVEGAVKYRVYYYGSRGWTKLAETTNNAFIDTDVSSNHTYTYTVRCINEDGTAFTSDYRPGKSIKYYAAPQLTLSNEEDGVRIKWNAIAGASKYRVYYKGSNGWTKLTDTSGTSVLDDDVASGTNYTYTIRAMDANNNHLSWYYTDGFRIQFIRAPQFSVSNEADGVKISWDKVGGAKKYRIFYYGSKGWTRMVDTADTSYIDKDVSSNHTFTYTVRCITEDGSAYTSDFRPGKSVKYVAAPKLTLSNTSSGVSIKWNAVAGASKYRVYYKGRNGWTKLTDSTGTSFVDTDVADGSSYTYTIRAMDANNNHLSWFYTDGFTITYHK
ncbi:hypothetical protein [uncultured Ruminococcus sp.]|uniref:hypothetical protein n=1 Tax=uncultured Ruminococcus sp. TaxID=165186 RepID=UPI002930D3FE|nr:hypothetical protein [uncultured Ruminococcus sp.]